MSSSFFSNNRMSGQRIIYTASTFARTNLIYLQEIGSTKYLQPYSSNRNGLNSFLFFIVSNGSGLLKYQNTTYTLKKGDCAFLNCNTPYSISSNEDLWSLSWIHFDGPTMHAIHEKFIERCGAPCFSAPSASMLLELHQKVYSDSQNDNYVRDLTIMGDLTTIITNIMENCWHKANDKLVTTSSKNWAQIKEYVDSNYTNEIRLDELSKIFHVNKFYLSRKFKELYGFTINQYILDKRVSKAKELLRFSDYTITEIASICGFNDISYFTRMFKSIEGITPSAFKKEWDNAFSYS